MISSIRPEYVFEKTVAFMGSFALLYTVTESFIIPLTPSPDQLFFRSLLDLALPFMIAYLLLFYIIFGKFFSKPFGWVTNTVIRLAKSAYVMHSLSYHSEHCTSSTLRRCELTHSIASRIGSSTKIGYGSGTRRCRERTGLTFTSHL